MTNTENGNNIHFASSDALTLVADIWRNHAYVARYPAYRYLTSEMGYVGHREYLSNLCCAIQNSLSDLGVDPTKARQKGLEAMEGCDLMTDIARLNNLSDEDCKAIRYHLPFNFVKENKI